MIGDVEVGDKVTGDWVAGDLEVGELEGSIVGETDNTLCMTVGICVGTFVKDRIVGLIDAIMLDVGIWDGSRVVGASVGKDCRGEKVGYCWHVSGLQEGSGGGNPRP